MVGIKKKKKMKNEKMGLAYYLGGLFTGLLRLRLAVLEPIDQLLFGIELLVVLGHAVLVLELLHRALLLEIGYRLLGYRARQGLAVAPRQRQLQLMDQGAALLLQLLLESRLVVELLAELLSLGFVKRLRIEVFLF